MFSDCLIPALWCVWPLQWVSLIIKVLNISLLSLIHSKFCSISFLYLEINNFWRVAARWWFLLRRSFSFEIFHLHGMLGIFDYQQMLRTEWIGKLRQLFVWNIYFFLQNSKWLKEFFKQEGKLQVQSFFF